MDKSDKTDKSDKADKNDKTEKNDKTDKGDKIDKIDKSDEISEMIEKLTNGASNNTSCININQNTQPPISNVPANMTSIANYNYYFNDDGMIIDGKDYEEVESTSTSNNNSSLVRRQTKKVQI